jgi:hypothetical protein
VNAGVRAAGNAASFNQADNLEAGTEALLGAGGSGNFQQRYQNRLALQHQADAESAREFPEIYKWGGRAADAAGIMAMDSPLAAKGLASLYPGGVKVAKAIDAFKPVGFIREGYGRLAGTIGGVTNAASQVADDVAQGRPVSLGDVTDAFVGGALGTAAAIRGRPALGAAIGSGLTTALQEGDRGNLSADSVLNSGLQGAYAGRLLATPAEQVSNALPMGVKQDLGEGLTFLKSWARGEPVPISKVNGVPTIAENLPGAMDATAGPQVPITLSNGATTRADWTTLWGRALEAEFGLSAALRRAQRFAPSDLYPNYLLDHWSPGNVGDIVGGAFGSTFSDRDPDADTP